MEQVLSLSFAGNSKCQRRVRSRGNLESSQQTRAELDRALNALAICCRRVEMARAQNDADDVTHRIPPLAEFGGELPKQLRRRIFTFVHIKAIELLAKELRRCRLFQRDANDIGRFPTARLFEKCLFTIVEMGRVVLKSSS